MATEAVLRIVRELETGSTLDDALALYGASDELRDAVLDHYVERIVREITRDVQAGTVPGSVSSFSELHDYVDANCYGGFCEDGFAAVANVEWINEVQERVDELLDKHTIC